MAVAHLSAQTDTQRTRGLLPTLRSRLPLSFRPAQASSSIPIARCESPAALPACLQVEAVKPQVAQARSSGSPITIQLQAALYDVSVPLHIDVRNPVHINIPVTITGQGPDKTILDCD